MSRRRYGTPIRIRSQTSGSVPRLRRGGGDGNCTNSTRKLLSLAAFASWVSGCRPSPVRRSAARGRPTSTSMIHSGGSGGTSRPSSSGTLLTRPASAGHRRAGNSSRATSMVSALPAAQARNTASRWMPAAAAGVTSRPSVPGPSRPSTTWACASWPSSSASADRVRAQVLRSTSKPRWSGAWSVARVSGGADQTVPSWASFGRRISSASSACTPVAATAAPTWPASGSTASEAASRIDGTAVARLSQ